MQDVLEILNYINVPQLVAIGIMLWFFYNRIDAKIETLKAETKDEVKGVNTRIDNLYGLIVNLFQIKKDDNAA